LAGAHIVDPAEAQSVQRVVDGLALRVEDTRFQSDEDARFHGRCLSLRMTPAAMDARRESGKLYPLFTFAGASSRRRIVDSGLRKGSPSSESRLPRASPCSD